MVSSLVLFNPVLVKNLKIIGKTSSQTVVNAASSKSKLRTCLYGEKYGRNLRIEFLLFFLSFKKFPLKTN